MAQAKQVQVTFDCADPGALASFWCEVLGYRIDPPPEGFASWDAFLDSVGVPQERRNDRSACSDPDGAGPRLFFQKVPEGKSAKNRVHLDVRAAPGLAGDDRMAALEAEAERLVALGATRVQRFDPGGMDAGHVVLQDPEGNEFCLD
jgi:catechol 2,3-dioxygenase-like lactoylglutathione lyase family enzyme